MSIGTLTTFPLIESYPPLGSCLICMNGILKDTNLSSNGYNSSSFGLSGSPILLAMDSLGILCCLIEALQVWQIHSVSSTDFWLVKQKAIRKIERMSFLYGMCFNNRVKKPGLMT